MEDVGADGDKARRRGDGAAETSGEVGREAAFHLPVFLLALPDS